MESEPPRPPDRTDLVALCRALNEQQAAYLVVGGMAVIQHGYLRATEDIDLLVEGSPENIRRVKKALEILPDRAVRQMADDDLENYTVVRVVDDLVVDLMLSACGIPYHEATGEIDEVEVDGVRIPFASAGLLLRMKQTGREKDRLDSLFLKEKLKRP